MVTGPFIAGGFGFLLPHPMQLLTHMLQEETPTMKTHLMTLAQICGQYGMTARELAMYCYPESLDHSDVFMVDQPSPVQMISRRPEFYDMSVTLATGEGREFTFQWPFMNAAMRSLGNGEFLARFAELGGIPVLHRMHVNKDEFGLSKSEQDRISLERQIAVMHELQERGVTPVMAIPVDIEWTDQLVAQGATLLCVDTLKMATSKVRMLSEHVRRRYGNSVWLCVGNTSNPSMALDYARLAVDAIKLGIGPGAVCSTCRETGHGGGQWTNTALTAAWLHEHRTELMESNGRMPMIITDGGIKQSGEVVKLLGAGADAVMIGTSFAGTEQSGLKVETIDGKRYRAHWGQASQFAIGRGADGEVAVEGVKTMVPDQGDLSKPFFRFRNGLCAGAAVTGALSLVDLQERARFVRATHHTVATGKPIAHKESEQHIKPGLG